MAQITITIPDNKLDDFVEYICQRDNYSEMIGGKPNPETKQQFAKRRIPEKLKEGYITWKQAQLRAETDVSNADINIT